MVNVQTINRTNSLLKSLSLAAYRIKMTSFTRLVNHSKQIRLFREIGKRLMNNLIRHMTQMQKVALSIWHKKLITLPKKLSILFQTLAKLQSQHQSLSHSAF
jgi:hypothetical protein